MAVLMDLEWVENGRQFSPTQLSARRVTDEWIETDRFYTRIRSTVEDDCTGAEMGLTGGLIPQFANAPTLMEVMTAFAKWLRPEDVLLWFNTNNTAFFSPTCGDMCLAKICYPSGLCAILFATAGQRASGMHRRVCWGWLARPLWERFSLSITR